jgi:hypothetical protein
MDVKDFEAEIARLRGLEAERYRELEQAYEDLTQSNEQQKSFIEVLQKRIRDAEKSKRRVEAQENEALV